MAKVKRSGHLLPQGGMALHPAGFGWHESCVDLVKSGPMPRKSDLMTCKGLIVPKMWSLLHID
ncbi:MAG: hypothetical protein V2I51_11575 [Anderseniella sp.]|nr:hypothetical protein [Anderseniella sp.]